MSRPRLFAVHLLVAVTVCACIYAAGLHARHALAAYRADQRDRVAALDEEWREHTTTTMPGIHYVSPVQIPAKEG
jgi:cell division protein FtsL